VYDARSTDGMLESAEKLNHAGIIPWKQDAKVSARRCGCRFSMNFDITGQKETGGCNLT
jgi:hypothetical protein